MNYLWVSCVRNMVLMLPLFYLLCIGTGHAMDDDFDSSRSGLSGKLAPRSEENPNRVVAEDSCFCLSCCFFIFMPSEWRICQKKSRISAELSSEEKVQLNCQNMEEDNSVTVIGTDDRSSDYSSCSKIKKTCPRPLEIIESYSDNSCVGATFRQEIRILFVEDESMAMKFFNNYITSINDDTENEFVCKAVVCNYGHEALDQYSCMVRANAPPHIIFADINMETFYFKNDVSRPEKAGIEFAKALRVRMDSNGNFDSLYRYEKLNHAKNGYICGDEKKDFLIAPYTGPIIALTSDPDKIKGRDRDLFYSEKELEATEGSDAISGIRNKLGTVKIDGKSILGKNDLIKILSHHSLC